MNRKILLTTFLVVIAAAGIALWYFLKDPALPDGLYSTNGRLEAEQVQVATKTAGRVAEVLVEEGQLVHEGDVLVRMDSQQLLAREREAQAQIKAAELAFEEADAGIEQRQALSSARHY